MRERVRNKLIQVARETLGPISYLVLVRHAELGINLDIKHESDTLGEILNEISEDELAEGRPLLSCMVKTKKGQGDHFFKFCEAQGLGEWRELKKDPDFHKDLRKETRKFWRDEENYKKYVNA